VPDRCLKVAFAEDGAPKDAFEAAIGFAGWFPVDEYEPDVASVVRCALMIGPDESGSNPTDDSGFGGGAYQRTLASSQFERDYPCQS
jgi:hypothetical protein